MSRLATKPLADLCEFRHGSTPSKAEPRNWGGSFPWVSPKDMRGEVISDTEDHLSDEVPLPPLPLQREFAARVAEVRAMEAGQAESRQRLDALFQSLLHRAFAGEL